MYILEQRLIAQSIPPEKAEKVIADIVRTMYNPKFLQELFKPQVIVSVFSAFLRFLRLMRSLWSEMTGMPCAGFVF